MQNLFKLWYTLGRRHSRKYDIVLKTRIGVKMTMNISDNIGTHVVFRVVQFNIIREKQ